MNKIKMKYFLSCFFLVAVAGISNADEASVDHSDFQCPLPHGKFSDKDIDMISSELGRSFVVAFGKNWASEEVIKKQIDTRAMTDIAKIASCAAVVDKENSCSIFYDPEFSTTLGVFTMLPRTASLRRQFDNAINALPAGREKTATQYCMKSVAKK